MIYFDHNATTPLDERALEAMFPYLQAFYGNPSSLYRIGRIARSAIETAREQLAALIEVQPAQIIFTSGGTEANNLALAHVPSSASAVAVSAIEHPSIIEPVVAKQAGFKQLTLLDVDDNGLVTSKAIKRLGLKKNDFVSMMLANNETGVIQDIAQFARPLSQRGVIFHTDAVQALGKIPFTFSELGVQLMSLSSHKIYGPKGCGALVVEKGFDVRPQLLGGGQENGYRAGTENVAAIVGFGKAAELAKTELTQRRQKLLELKQYLEKELLKFSGLVIFAEDAERLPNTVQMAMEGVDGEMLLMQLDKKNIAVSSGSACSSGGGRVSPVLAAMGVEPDLAKGAIRISLGKSSSKQDINEFILVLKNLLKS